VHTLFFSALQDDKYSLTYAGFRESCTFGSKTATAWVSENFLAARGAFIAHARSQLQCGACVQLDNFTT